jgi:AcrR family transcriptional regulator
LKEMKNKIRKRKNTIERQKQIIEASRKLVIKYGSEHITVRKIAQAINVSEGAIYRHFRSKRDIFLFLIDDIENSWLRDIKHSSSPDRSTLEVLQTLAETHISEVEQRKGVTFQVVAEIISLGDKKLNKRISEAIQKYLVKVSEIYALGIEKGDIRNSIDVDATAMLFFSMVQGLTNTWVLGGYKFDLVEKFMAVWDTFYNGIKT